MKLNRINAAVFSASLLLSSTYTWAGAKYEGEYQLAQAKSRTDKSLAADIATKQYGGKVLKVDKINRKNKAAYRVKLLLDSGKIKIVTVDAIEGKVI